MNIERLEKMLKRAGPTTKRMVKLVMDEPGHTAAWYITRVPMRAAQFHHMARKYQLPYLKANMGYKEQREYKLIQPMEGMCYQTAKLLSSRGRLGVSAKLLME